MNCKDCYHYEVCSQHNEWKSTQGNFIDNAFIDCKFSVDKNKIVELPCKVGDTVYCFCETFGAVLPYKIECIHFWSNNIVQIEAFSSGDGELLDTIDFEPNDIGKTVFLAIEEM